MSKIKFTGLHSDDSEGLHIAESKNWGVITKMIEGV